MSLIVRLPPRVERELAEHCVKHHLTKGQAVQLALEELLRAPVAGAHDSRHPFIGGDKGDGSDMSGNIKAALHARFRGYARKRPTLRKTAYSSGDHK